jgi:hypothetical protein
MSRKMNSIILSSGIAGIDWPASINLLGTASDAISHFDNVMSNTKGKYDDLVLEKTEIKATQKKLEPQFKGYLTRLLKNDKSQISFLSDPIFLDSGAGWHKFNEDKSYAFFFCSPEYYLAKIDNESDEGINVDQQECLDNWLEDASKIWGFYVRYPDNTLLINIEDVAKDPVSSVSKIAEFLGCELDDIDKVQAANGATTAVENPTEKLSLLLLENMKLDTIKASSELNELYENLALTSILADDALTYQANERANIRLSECQNLIAVISARQVQLESASASFAASNSELIVDNEKLKAEFATRTSALETNLAKHTAENELALLQIQQLQEELEVAYLKNTESKEEFTARTSGLETRISALTAENELALLQIQQLQEELETSYLNSTELKSELAAGASALETSISESTAENELALLQINQLQEELETSYLNANEHKGKLAAGESALERRIAELTAENEVALLQINQLQEELEHYYIQYQKMTYSPKREISYATDLNRVKVSLSLMNMN